MGVDDEEEEDDSEEELRMLREENRALQHALGMAQHSVSSQRGAILAITQERDILFRKVCKSKT